MEILERRDKVNFSAYTTHTTLVNSSKETQSNSRIILRQGSMYYLDNRAEKLEEVQSSMVYLVLMYTCVLLFQFSRDISKSESVAM